MSQEVGVDMTRFIVGRDTGNQHQTRLLHQVPTLNPVPWLRLIVDRKPKRTATCCWWDSQSHLKGNRPHHSWIAHLIHDVRIANKTAALMEAGGNAKGVTHVVKADDDSYVWIDRLERALQVHSPSSTMHVLSCDWSVDLG